MIFWWLLAIGFAGPRGGQSDFERVQTETGWAFRSTWRDAAGTRQTVAFELPAEHVQADRAEITWLPRAELNQHVVRELRAWGRTVPGTRVRARVERGRIRVSATGPDARGVVRDAEAIRDRATDDWLAEHGFTRLSVRGGPKNAVSFDHARLVDDYDERLEPVARALREGTRSEREFVERALSFVQAIPYEARKRRGGDPGYRRPLALLFRNRGDCDSKAVLFLGIVRAELPDLPLAVIYVPGHALAAVGETLAASHDPTFRAHGTRWIYAEPVGPSRLPLGEPARDHRRAGKRGEVRVVPPEPVEAR